MRGFDEWRSDGYGSRGARSIGGVHELRKNRAHGRREKEYRRTKNTQLYFSTEVVAIKFGGWRIWKEGSDSREAADGAARSWFPHVHRLGPRAPRDSESTCQQHGSVTAVTQVDSQRHELFVHIKSYETT